MIHSSTSQQRTARRLPGRRTAVAVAAAAALGLAGLGPVAASPKPHHGHGHGTGHHWVERTLSRMSLEQKVGQLFVQNVYGSDATTPDARNRPLYGVDSPAEVVKKYHLGGIIYFNWTDSVKDPQQIAGLSNGLQRAALTPQRTTAKDRHRPTSPAIPLQVSVDQEQGVVTRIGPPATQFPGSMALGASRSQRDARTAAAITGAELRAMGVNTDFAPDADVNVNPLNPVIGTRSFSSDPRLVAAMVASQVRGYQQDGNVAASAKHFPGHGDTATDSHVAFPVITHSRAEWEQLDAPPFKAAIASGIDMIMTAHLSFPALDDSGDPATLSKPILTDLLRKKLGYQGVIVTDSLAMEGVREKYGDAEVAVKALEAGADQLLMTPAMDEAFAAVVKAVRTGRITTKQLDAKVRRVLELKVERGIVTKPFVDTRRVDRTVGTTRHLAAAAAVSDRTTTLVSNDDKVLPLAAKDKKVLVTGYGAEATKTLAAGIERAGATTTVKETGAAPTDDAISAAVAAARDQDTVVVTTMKAGDTTTTDPKGGQKKLVAALQATGKPVVVVATRDPYDVAHLGDVPTYLATYSYSPVALESAARVITGQMRPTGKLPVDIPSAADPDTTLFPFGHGLTY